MHRRWRRLASLVVLTGMLAALMLAGCKEDIDESLALDVDNRSFTFTDGAVFHIALANQMTTLSFTNNGDRFTLSSSTGTAIGRARFRPCSLTVDPEPDGSTYASFTTGPQGDDVVVLSTCDFDLKTNVLVLGNGTIIAISAPAVALETN